MTRRGRLGVAAALAVVYAVCYSAIKSGLAYAPPLRFGGLRAMVAGAFLLALLALMRRSILPQRRLWPGITVIAATGTLMAFAAMFSAPGRTGAGIASVLGNTTPLMTIALAVPFLGETVSRAKAAALVLGFAGAALVAYPALTDPAHHGLTGALLPLIAAAGFAISSVVFKRIDARGAVLHVAAWQLLLGGAPLLVISALVESQTTIEWNAPFLGLLLFLALVGTALTTAVWYWLVQRDDVGRLSVVLFLVPAIGLGLGVTLFDERFDIPEVLGVGLVFMALAAIVVEGRASRAGRRGLYHTCQVTDRAIVIPENGGCTMKVQDEVCGMNIDSESAAASFELKGKTYFFCCERCRRKFEEHPDWYVPVSKDDHDDGT